MGMAGSGALRLIYCCLHPHYPITGEFKTPANLAVSWGVYKETI